MRKKILVVCLVAFLLAAAGRGEAQERGLRDLRQELEAMTESLSAQTKLLAIYEDLGKAEEAAATRKRILDMIDSHRRLLDRIAVRVGGKAPARLRIVGVGGRRRGGSLASPPLTTPLPRSVHLGLDWLARHQDPDGFWDCDGFMRQDETAPQCDGPGHSLYDPGVSGLALLAFLGAGQTHKVGRYQKAVREGLRHLKAIQDPEGCFGPRTTNHFIYNTAIAAQAMARAYGQTRSPLFKNSAQRGIDFIQKCQNPYLAWRYGVRPGDNDTSVTGWAVAALHAGIEAGLRVDASGMQGAMAWLEKVTEPEYGRVGYTSRGTGPARPQDLMDQFPADKSEALTAVGIFIRLCAGEKAALSTPIQKGLDLLLKAPPTWDAAGGAVDMYYWYWGTKACAEVGGEAWRKWSKALREAIVSRQRTDGDFKGSFDPIGPWGREGGRVYSTALMTLALEALAEVEKK